MCRAALALLLVAAMPLVAQEPSKEPEAPELVQYKDASGKVRIWLPKTWRTRPLLPQNEHVLITLDIQIPGEKQTMVFDVTLLPGVALRPEAQGWYELPTQMEREKSTAGKVWSKPVPHLVADINLDDRGPKQALVIGMRRFRCQGIHARLVCSQTTWARPDVQGAFFRMMQGIQCTLPRWPEMPVKEDQYKIVGRDGLVFYVQNGVSQKGRKRIENLVCALQKSFVKFHGPITRPEDEPPLIFVHADVAMHKSFSEEAAADREGMYAEPRKRRVFALGHEGSSRLPEANLAYQVTDLFITERYGVEEPAWFQIGECFVAETRLRLGKDLPFVTQHFADQRSRINRRLTELKDLRKTKWDDYFAHGQAYGAFFRAGPSKYRRAYRAFFKEFAETCNYEGAVKSHLYSLDQNDLYKNLRRFLETKLRPLRAD